MTPNDAYGHLLARFRRIGLLDEAGRILHWDAATMMPSGAADGRAEQLAALRETAHGLLTAPDVGEWLAAVDDGALDAAGRADVALMRRRRLRAAALPGDLVTAISLADSRCEMAWRAARAADDFATVRPLLQRVLELTREEAQATGEALGLAPYDALLDAHEPGLAAADCERVFAALESFLPDLLGAALERQALRGEPLAPRGPFPAARQDALARRVMADLGFDFDHGRLDLSAHPMSVGAPDDVRITTRWDEADALAGLYAVVHETGHALYERGLPAARRWQPAGEPRGMAVHESQSLIFEMQAGRSPAFAVFLAPLLAAAFGADVAWGPENLHRLVTRVRRGLIRVDADEVSYPLHVVLRFRLERAMLAGDLALADLPGAWRDGMQRLVGAVPPDDRDGCLQDIHWYDGAFGYFPSYTFGALMAAQLYDAAARAEPEMPRAVGRGDFAPLVAWLRRHVHGLGATRSWQQILEGATGRPLDVAVFRRHLEARYLGDG
ncbi:MAG: carboxypeptidase M32 [Alphaproteobacteria bacterium]|nr:carboxypeptidase M32 [Alphaproteobacteria bacterium]